MKRIVRPLTVLFEIDFNNYGQPFTLRPGWHKAPFRDGYFCRVWWLCFAVAWVRMPLHEYNAHIASGATEWRRPTQKVRFRNE